MKFPSSITLLLLLIFGPSISASAQQDKTRHVHTNRKNAKTLPLTKEKGVWHFIIYGDRTGGPVSGLKILKQAVKDSNLLDPDLVMTVGDLIQGYNTRAPWIRQAKEYTSIMDQLSMPWYPVAGNHDIYWRGPGRKAGEHDQDYEKHFGPLWYWFPHKDSAFIVLFTDEGDPKTGRKGFRRPQDIQMSNMQLKWLKETLVKTKKYKHVMVFMHHPRWMTRIYKKNNWNLAHKLLVAAGNVRGVFAGHIHRMVYSGKKDGIEYFALGATGGHISMDLPKLGFLHHYNVVTVRDDGLKVSTLPVGAVIDPKTIDLTRHAEVLSLIKGRPLTVENHLKIPFNKADKSGTYAVRIDNPTSHTIEVNLILNSSKTWAFQPAHAHVVIKPGKSAKVAFRYQIKVAQLQSAYSLPKMQIQVDYLAKDVRISLPERQHILKAKMDRLPREFSGRGVNRSLLLDGENSCLKISSRPITLKKIGFTLEGWVKADNLQGRRPFLSKTESSGYGIYLNKGFPKAYLHINKRYVSLNSSIQMTAKKWHHIAAVYDGKEFRLYLDGKKVAAAPATGAHTPNRWPLYIGADPNKYGQPVDFLPGQIDEVRLSNTPRYTGKEFTVSKRFESDDKTLLLLHFDRDLGPYVIDHSAKKNHGQRLGSARCVGQSH
jgi:hypothetical protein